jgi:Zn-dependent protease
MDPRPIDPRFEVLPPGPPQPKKSFLQSIGAGIVAIFVALAKFKFLLFGGLKTGLSMFVMIWVYSMFYGWPFAAGFVLLIFVHEMGHVVAAKWVGIPVSAPIFIPFIGAAITMKQNPRDAWTEALMAYGGPLAGGLGGWICWWIAMNWDLPWLMAVAAATFVINLFNLIPVPPLDGGRICAAVSPWFWFLGLLLLGASLFVFQGTVSIIILVLVLFVAVPRLKQTFLQRNSPEMQAYYNTHISNRISMALLYFGLIMFLLFGYWDASHHLHPTTYD